MPIAPSRMPKGPPAATPPPEIDQTVRALRVLNPGAEVKAIPLPYPPGGWKVFVEPINFLIAPKLQIEKLMKKLQALNPGAELKAVPPSNGSDEWSVEGNGYVVYPEPSDDDAPSAFDDKDHGDDPKEVAAYLAYRFVQTRVCDDRNLLQTSVYDRETCQTVTDNNGEIRFDMPTNVRVAFDKYKEIGLANDINITVCAKCGKISGRLRSVTVCTCGDGTKIYWCRKCCDRWDDGVEGPESLNFLLSLRTLTLRVLESDSYVF